MQFIEILRTFRSAQNIFSKTTSLPTKLSTIGLFLLLASISGCDSSTNAQSPQQKWTGEWKITHPYSDSFSQKVRFILTPEGKAYLIIPDSATNEKVAYEIPLEKVSNRASLPANIKVVTVEEQVKEAEKKREEAEKIDGKIYVGSMNRAQQAYFLENAKFSTSIEKLGLGIKSETEDYTFKIMPQSNQKESVMNIAQAKREGLKSYVGLVYSTKVDNDTGETITYTKLCETSEALSKLPQMPEIPKNSSEIIECPSGFKSLW